MDITGKYVVGVDCGSGSVRAGLFDLSTGKLLTTAVKDITINNPEKDYYEQSTDEIWSCIVTTVKEVLQKNPGAAENVIGIAFCATCSVAAVGENGKQVSINKNGDPFNIIMWMDHRAGVETQFINSTKHPVLKYVGGNISLEMETPKLLWLKKNLPKSYHDTKHFFDLGDFLRWRATGCLDRSVCCIVCKWTHVNEEERNYWDKTYFEQVGIADAVPKIGDTFSFPGDSVAICPKVAEELGLRPDVKVGFSQIDAHSGVLGMIGCGDVPREKVGLGRLALISGTSVCHMALSPKSITVPGVWGPYYGVILKELYLSEGGQSAAGKLLDHVVMSHVAYPALAKECENKLGKVLSYLEDLLTTGKKSEITEDLHMWPDYHGNRSPIADPTLKGMLSGLTLSNTRDSLAAVYLATMQALAYGSRHIKEDMEKAGHSFQELVICGGLTKSKVYLQTHADVIGLPVIVPDCAEPVLLGAAMSAAAAAELTRVRDIVPRLSGGCTVLKPNPKVKSFHDRKYKVFLAMIEDQKKYREMMKSDENDVNGN